MRRFEKLTCCKCGKDEVVEALVRGLTSSLGCIGTIGGGFAIGQSRYEQWCQILSPKSGSVMLFCPECTSTPASTPEPPWADLV